MYYLHQGLNQNVEMVTNASGAVVERYAVSLYGSFQIQDAAGQARASSIFGNDMVFQGRPYDAVLAFYDFRNRWYSPTQGRFISRDALGYAAGDINPYRFVFNNPVNGLDPSGNNQFLGLLTSPVGFVILAVAVVYLSTKPGQEAVKNFGKSTVNGAEKMANAAKTVATNVYDNKCLYVNSVKCGQGCE